MLEFRRANESELLDSIIKEAGEDAFEKANRAWHSVNKEWFYKDMKKYGWKPDKNKAQGFVRSYLFTHSKIPNKIRASTGASADHWEDETTKEHGYWRGLEPHLKKLKTKFKEAKKISAQEDWLDKEVHNPATGRTVKVKSLSPKNREKYKPKSPGEPLVGEGHIPNDYLRNVQVAASDSGHVFSVDFKGKKPSDFNFNEKNDHKDIALKGKANISYDKKHKKWLTMDEDSVYKHLEEAVGNGDIELTQHDGDEIYQSDKNKPTLLDIKKEEEKRRLKGGPGEPGR